MQRNSNDQRLLTNFELYRMAYTDLTASGLSGIAMWLGWTLAFAEAFGANANECQGGKVTGAQDEAQNVTN